MSAMREQDRRYPWRRLDRVAQHAFLHAERHPDNVHARRRSDRLRDEANYQAREMWNTPQVRRAFAALAFLNANSRARFNCAARGE